MWRATSTSGWITAVFAFEADIFCSLIDPDDSHRQRGSAAFSKLNDLIAQVVDDPIDLFDHRLRQYFNLYTNFESGNGSPCNGEPWLDHRNLTGDDFPEGAIAASGLNSVGPVADIHNL